MMHQFKIYYFVLFHGKKEFNFSTIHYHNFLNCKTLSARTKSPGQRYSNRPEFSVIKTSDTRPPHPLEMKGITPCGATLTGNVAVLCCLWLDHDYALVRRLVGLTKHLKTIHY